MSIEYDIYVPNPIVNSGYPSPYFFLNLFSFYINKIFTIQLKPYQSIIWTSLVAQRLKHLSTMQETWVQSLGWKDSPGEGNGNPLQYYCLGNPIDREAW